MNTTPLTATKKSYKVNELIGMRGGNIRILSGYCLLMHLTTYDDYNGVGLLKSGDVISASMFDNFEEAGFYLRALTSLEIEVVSDSMEFSALSQLATLRKIANLSVELGKSRRVSEKLEAFLIYCQKEQDSNQKELSFRINQNDLASIVGSTRVTITRTLAKMQQTGKIKMINKRIEIGV